MTTDHTATIALVVGTRPEAIKLAPLARHLGDAALVIHTGQHYSNGMTGDLEPDLLLTSHPDHGATRGHQLGYLTSALDHVLTQREPAAVVVQGDTTSALAGALAANTTGIPLIHVEAGLRSFDRAMPEEHNRVLIDHLADLCCAPTELARSHLLAERIPTDRIEVTGNTIVEAVAHALPTDAEQAHTLIQFGLVRHRYVLATIHRPENTDHAATLGVILRELAALPEPVVLPLHPRTHRRIVHFKLAGIADRLRLTGPLDYPTLLTLIRHSAIIVTDSGGVQEEATVLNRPLLVVRRSNERPEVEGIFGTRVHPGPAITATLTPWLDNRDTLHTRLAELASPYGDGTATIRISNAIRARFILGARACW